MESAWQNDLPRSAEEEEDRWFGQILERSTSAPPMNSEPNPNLEGLGSEDDRFLFGRATDVGKSRLGLYDGKGRDTAPVAETDSQKFGLLDYGEHDTGRATAPGLFGDLRSVSSSGDMHKGYDFLQAPPETSLLRSQSDAPTFLGAPPQTSLTRSQSAAPTLLGAPPGLGLGLGLERQTTGDSSSIFSDHTGADRQDIMQLGQRRPASTGVIGEHSEQGDFSGGAVRPAPKTLMDLINEDTSPVYERASPQPATYNAEYENRAQPPQQRENLGGLSPSMERMDARLGETYQQQHVHIQADAQYRPVHNISQQRAVPHSEPRPMYASAGHGAPQHVLQTRDFQPQHPRMQYEAAPPLYYPDQQPRPIPPTVQAQILPSGQTVYVSSAPPYGYTTLQYHPAATAPHPHQPHPSLQGAPPGHEYMSVVPIQAGPAGQVYWQHQSDVPTGAGHGLAPAMAVINTRGGTRAMSMPRGSPAPLETSPGGGRHGRTRGTRSPNEKGGRGRRGGGGNTGRRGGADSHSKHSTGVAAGSPLLEEFRASKHRDWTMVDIRGHVVEFCQDQNGSRFIQQRLEIGNDTEQQIVMAEVLPAVKRLRNDVFGNYVVQKLLEFGTPQMRADLRDSLKGEMLHLSLQMYGCRVVQKALEALGEEDLPRLLMEFHHNVISCIHDQNGNHVIQKCIEVMSTKAKNALEAGNESQAAFFNEQIEFVIDDVLGNVQSLSCHPYGCRVLQRILEHCVDSTRERALDEIRQCHRALLDDQYGNYVIQHVLKYGRISDRDSILQIVVENGLLRLSKQKFASNVVEKLLNYGTPGQRNSIVREMLKFVDNNEVQPDGTLGKSSVVLLMVRDAYANYVVQTALDVVSEGEEKRLLLEELNAHSEELRNYTFAKHIVTKLSS